MKSRTLAVIALFSVTLGSLVAEAGYQLNPAPYCYKYADGSGYCLGNMEGFRFAADATAYATFSNFYTTNYKAFSARVNSVYYGCVAQAGSIPANNWKDIMDARDYFQISWDAAGNCTNGYLVKSSQYSYF